MIGFVGARRMAKGIGCILLIKWVSGLSSWNYKHLRPVAPRVTNTYPLTRGRAVLIACLRKGHYDPTAFMTGMKSNSTLYTDLPALASDFEFGWCPNFKCSADL